MIAIIQLGSHSIRKRNLSTVELVKYYSLCGSKSSRFTGDDGMRFVFLLLHPLY